MVLYYAELLRQVGFRDNNWKPLASNDPSIFTLGWAIDAGGSVGASSDGDLLTLLGTDASHGIAAAISGSISTTTNPVIVVRARTATTSTCALDVQVNYVAGGSDTFTMNLTSSLQTFSFNMTTGKVLNTIRFLNQSVPASLRIDYVYACGQAPLQLSAKDLVSGAVTKTALGVDHAEFRMNNWRGKFVAGPNAIGFGDHMHVYLGQGATLNHVYGGYAEVLEPTMPSDEIMIQSRGFGLALLRARVLASYSGKTPRQIYNDFVDSQVNNSNKDGVGITSNYQLTRSYVQDLGSAIPLYLAYMSPAYNAMREIADLNTVQSAPSLFFVDPAENLHFVPLGAQGAANWTTDPFPATYAGSLAYGKNLVTLRLPRDSQSIINRVKYIGVAQIPGLIDAWTEQSASNWSTLAAQHCTATVSDVTTPVAIGNYSVNAKMAYTSGTGTINAVFRYPGSGSLGLNLQQLSSANSPPLIEFFLRWHQDSGPADAAFCQLNFSESGVPLTGNCFSYAITGVGPAGQQNIIPTMNQDYWYHVILPFGPFGGTLWEQPPMPNVIGNPSFSGASGYQLANTGTPHWNNINTLDFLFVNNQGSTVEYYIDGLRMVGGRYRIAYDNRASPPRYKDMSETFVYDPVSKDETAIKNFAAAELLRNRNPILRGPIVTPLLADLLPEQQVQCTIPSAGYASPTYLRVTEVTHRFSPNGFLTEIALSDDFLNSQPLQPWKLSNVLLEMGENAIFSRQLADLKTATLDPTFTPILDPYT